MKLRNRTSQKINQLQEESSFEDDFKEAVSTKLMKKRKNKDKKTCKYFERKAEDSFSDEEQVNKKAKKNDKKSLKIKQTVKEKSVDTVEVNQIDAVKSELNKIENIENKIDLLLKFESNSNCLNVNKKIKNENQISEIDSDSNLESHMDEDDDDFEEVEMQEANLTNAKIGREEIQIKIGGKRTKKTIDLKAKMERMLKNMQKKASITMLKTYLLCWIAHGFFINQLVRNLFIQSLVLSINSHSDNFQLVNFNKDKLIKLIDNIYSIFDLDSIKTQKEDFQKPSRHTHSIKTLGHALSNKKVNNYLQYLLIVVAWMRILDIKCRICVCCDVWSVNQKFKTKTKKLHKPKENSNSDDSDDGKSDEKKSNKPTQKDKKKVEKNNLILSMDESKLEMDIQNTMPKSDNYNNYWLEAYLEEEKYWCPFEPVTKKIDCASWLEKRLNNDCLYVLAFDNQNKIKDVTKRYSSDWCIKTRLARVSHLDDKKLWWEKTLLYHQPIDAQMDIEEEKYLKQLLLKRPMPQSVSEFKDHPLYILPRHLLKFQSIYPQNVLPVTHFKNEPVYSRDNLVTLCSKQTWLKYARTVKSYEKPFKIVKGRLKRSEYKAGCRENPDLDLYGFWQTEKYQPPYARNGIVPRNEFGNVELFQPCMLPHGCVHLRDMPNLIKVCRKLNIDCAAAVVGFDAHGGFSHAVYDGWIVCQEFKDVVIDAYLEEERENNLKIIQKKKEKVMNNWKRLVKGALIRQKLMLKYGDNSEIKSKPKCRNKFIKKAQNDGLATLEIKQDEFMEVDKVGAKLNYQIDDKIESNDKINDFNELTKKEGYEFNFKKKTQLAKKKKFKRKRKYDDCESSEDEDEKKSQSGIDLEKEIIRPMAITTRSNVLKQQLEHVNGKNQLKNDEFKLSESESD